MKHKCWKCRKENEEQIDGYCNCTGCGNTYMPIKKEKKIPDCLDAEERGEWRD